jgi:predicted nucleic acid-binding protein
VVLLDSNIPMYLIGRDAALAARARSAIQSLTIANETLVTDAEVFQEVLHRYRSIGRDQLIGHAFLLLKRLSRLVLPIDLEVIEQARAVMLQHPKISARDAVHVSIMNVHGITRILSFDAGFDRVPGITRLTDGAI